MIYTSNYASPLGNLLLAADEDALIGLWIENQKYYADILEGEISLHKTDLLMLAEKWLDIYFEGQEPDFMPPIRLTGTRFWKDVWKILLDIPYGHTMTYLEIARKLAQDRNVPQMSARAVGGAVGHNPISIIIPCHRVVGANGNLTGYAGGIDNKAKLLKLEKQCME